jgi:Ca-activated chloride channel family protein
MIAVAISLVAVAVSAETPSAAQLVREGNRLLVDGNAQEALQRYRRAEVLEKESPHVAYDLGMAQFELKQFEEARKAFDKALYAKDSALSRRARHGLGTADHSEALGKLETPDEAIKLLEGAMAHYSAVLEEERDSKPAQTAIRRAALMRRKLMDELKRRQEEQQKKDDEQQDQDQENQEQGEQNQQGQQDQKQQQDKDEKSDRKDEPQSRPSASSPPKPTPQPTPSGSPQPTSAPQTGQQASPTPAPTKPKSLSRQEAERNLRAMMDRQKRRKRDRKPDVPVIEIPFTIEKNW